MFLHERAFSLGQVSLGQPGLAICAMGRNARRGELCNGESRKLAHRAVVRGMDFVLLSSHTTLRAYEQGAPDDLVVEVRLRENLLWPDVWFKIIARRYIGFGHPKIRYGREDK